MSADHKKDLIEGRMHGYASKLVSAFVSVFEMSITPRFDRIGTVVTFDFALPTVSFRNLLANFKRIKKTCEYFTPHEVRISANPTNKCIDIKGAYHCFLHKQQTRRTEWNTVEFAVKMAKKTRKLWEHVEFDGEDAESGEKHHSKRMKTANGTAVEAKADASVSSSTDFLEAEEGIKEVLSAVVTHRAMCMPSIKKGEVLCEGISSFLFEDLNGVYHWLLKTFGQSRSNDKGWLDCEYTPDGALRVLLRFEQMPQAAGRPNPDTTASSTNTATPLSTASASASPSTSSATQTPAAAKT
jgi:hypothetical protein